MELPPDDPGGAPTAVVLPDATEAVESDPKSKLLSTPKGPVVTDSLLAWLGGGLLSKTALKSSRPDREMLAKSSSADPSLASSRPSKSSSKSSKAPFVTAAAEGTGAVCWVGARRLVTGAAGPSTEPKISSTLDPEILWILVGAEGEGEAGFSLRQNISGRIIDAKKHWLDKKVETKEMGVLVGVRRIRT